MTFFTKIVQGCGVWGLCWGLEGGGTTTRPTPVGVAGLSMHAWAPGGSTHTWAWASSHGGVVLSEVQHLREPGRSHSAFMAQTQKSHSVVTLPLSVGRGRYRASSGFKWWGILYLSAEEVSIALQEELLGWNT